MKTTLKGKDTPKPSASFMHLINIKPHLEINFKIRFVLLAHLSCQKKKKKNLPWKGQTKLIFIYFARQTRLCKQNFVKNVHFKRVKSYIENILFYVRIAKKYVYWYHT